LVLLMVAMEGGVYGLAVYDFIRYSTVQESCGTACPATS
jgi:hypothetical protein